MIKRFEIKFPTNPDGTMDIRILEALSVGVDILNIVVPEGSTDWAIYTLESPQEEYIYIVLNLIKDLGASYRVLEN